MSGLRIAQVDCGRRVQGGQWQLKRLIEGLAARGHVPLVMKPWELASAKVDLVHAHDARAHAWAAALASRQLVVSRRVAFPLRSGALTRWKYARARHYVAVSNFVRDVMIQGGIPRSKISVVNDGVPCLPQSCGTAVLAPANKRSGLLDQAVDLAGVELRYSKQLEEDLSSARLLVYISFSEGLGSGALLAMSAGVPVIASRVGGLPEAVDDGHTGLLVSNDAEEIASAMRRLLDDPALAQTLGGEARRVAHERFSVDRMVDETIAVYRRVLSC